MHTLDHQLIAALRPEHFPHGVDELLARIIMRKARNFVSHGYHPQYAVALAARWVNLNEEWRNA